MTPYAYAAALLVSTGAMMLLDARFALVLWRDTVRSLVVLAIGIAFFLLWDVVAIGQGFYHRGESAAMTGLMLAPELPVEELLFITFLCYVTLVMHGLVGLTLARTGAGRR
ncbi:MAG: lycopene cyclase domain-containing protein [Ornithinimicrobium sp.]|uniref:lycopene cyclase domain-containing protein n=1 Tax=Ornithinimicrobium sp. TaxID=1977084 RepID=UPI0026DF5253|nr:lycopene cyclase domain-containing protein [Ornithinimicrobium sp.]MDO5740759.1 lycopene cyclase domain-containing protein [Ornithinimicrobium sp.]